MKRRGSFFVLSAALLISLAGFGGPIGYTYDAAGRLIKADYGEGRTITYAYDANGNLLDRVVTGAGPVIPGDCNGDGTVSIGEVQKAINMFLGTEPVGCGADCDGNGSISIGEVQKVINAFLGVSTTC